MPELPPIVTKAYDFALWRLPRVQDFPRSSRFVLGDCLIATLGFFISSFSAVLALDFTDPIVSVLDGDTLEVLHNQYPERIRLSGIDCPEKGPVYGQRTRSSLRRSG